MYIDDKGKEFSEEDQLLLFFLLHQMTKLDKMEENDFFNKWVKEHDKNNNGRVEKEELEDFVRKRIAIDKERREKTKLNMENEKKKGFEPFHWSLFGKANDIRKKKYKKPMTEEEMIKFRVNLILKKFDLNKDNSITAEEFKEAIYNSNMDRLLEFSTKEHIVELTKTRSNYINNFFSHSLDELKADCDKQFGECKNIYECGKKTLVEHPEKILAFAFYELLIISNVEENGDYYFDCLKNPNKVYEKLKNFYLPKFELVLKHFS